MTGVAFTKYQHFLAFFIVFEWAEFWKVQWINRKWYVMQSYVVIIFPWTFQHWQLNFTDKLKKNPTIFPEIVGFWKIASEIQRLVRKHSQKINYNVILHHISFPIYALHFTKFCFIQKQNTLRNCQCLVKTICLVFYKLIFFETLIISTI